MARHLRGGEIFCDWRAAHDPILESGHENAGDRVEHDVVRVVERRRRPGDHDAGSVDRRLEPNAALACGRRGAGRSGRRPGPGDDGPKISGNDAHGAVLRDITGQREHRVGRPVPPVQAGPHLGRRHRRELGRGLGGAAVGVLRAVNCPAHLGHHPGVRHVQPGQLVIGLGLAPAGQGLGLDAVGEERHPIALHPEGEVERGGGHGELDPGSVGVCIDMHVPPLGAHGPGQLAPIVVCQVPGRAVGQEPPHELAHPAAIGRVILRSDAVAQAQCDHGGAVVLVHEHREPVRQRELLESKRRPDRRPRRGVRGGPGGQRQRARDKRRQHLCTTEYQCSPFLKRRE